jgi:hypothetical protein
VIVGLEHSYDTALMIRADHTLIPLSGLGPAQSGPPSIPGLKAALEQVIRWTADSKFALDQLQRMANETRSVLFGHLDLSRIGIFGHSLGGKAVAPFVDIYVAEQLASDAQHGHFGAWGGYCRNKYLCGPVASSCRKPAYSCLL